jgi:glycolate oxidase subunit GlcD
LTGRAPAGPAAAEPGAGPAAVTGGITVLAPAERRQLLDELEGAIGSRWVLHRPGELLPYEHDGFTLERGLPLAVVQPESTAQVAAVLAILHRHRVPFIPRGAGTGLSGGAVPRGGDVVVSLTRMTRLLEVDAESRRAVVEAGHVNLDLTRRVEHLGYYYAPDPSSQAACTLGGNVAENAGGPHCLKYGVTLNHVLGLTVVLSGGRVARLGSKASGSPGYDLVGLLVGSEGTMGVVTEITVRLLRRPQAVRTALALFDRLEPAADAVAGITAAGIVPAALEMMDRWAIEAVERGQYPVGYPPGLEAVLLAEVDGLEQGLDEQMERLLAVCRRHGVREVRVAASEAERAAWWNNRKTAFGAMGTLAPDYYVQDGVIPRSRLAPVLAEIRALGEREGLTIANVFHAGDGNLHPLIAYDRRQPGMIERVVRAGSEILRICLAHGGSITGEHGVGIEKLEELRLQFSDRDLEAQRWAREAFDPAGLANPGKALPAPGRCADLRVLAGRPGLEAW